MRLVRVRLPSESRPRCGTSCRRRQVQLSILSRQKGSRSPIQRKQRWRRNLNRPTENATFVESHRRMKRRCVRLGKQRASTVANSVILGSYADQRSQFLRSPNTLIRRWRLSRGGDKEWRPMDIDRCHGGNGDSMSGRSLLQVGHWGGCDCNLSK